MKESYRVTYMQLRYLVGYLGERSQFGWWPTAFFDPSSRLFLEPSFPRTARLAQYHAVIDAACRVHDEHIGVGSAFHLFRLPEELEQDLHRLSISSANNEPLNSALQNKEAALHVLADIASANASEAEGPVAIGTVPELRDPRLLGSMARTYLAAFMAGVKTYPYFRPPS